MCNHRITKKWYTFDCALLLLKCKKNSVYNSMRCCFEGEGFVHTWNPSTNINIPKVYVQNISEV